MGYKKILVPILVVSLILNTLYIFQTFSPSDTEKFVDNYPLLSKRLANEDHNDILIDFDPLRKDLREYLSTLTAPHSFYFEYLPTGTSIRDGDNNDFVGASLMKTPIVMSLYKAAELEKVSLDKKVTVLKSDISNDNLFGNVEGLKVGQEITLKEAARRALVESDNTSASIVYRESIDLLAPKEQAINNLDIEIELKEAESGGEYVLISARSYSSILKCLYLACYLSNDSSQEILKSLSESKTEERIRAGVPKSIRVANKIGSFSDQTQSDCGIVYEPNRPYLICLMVQKSAVNISEVFKKVSELAYDYVKQVN